MSRRRYDYKEWVVRHGHAPRRARDSEERAIERKVRQQGQREVREALSDDRTGASG